MLQSRWKKLASVLMLSGLLSACGGGTTDGDIGRFDPASVPDAPIAGGSGGSSGGGNSLTVNTGEAAALVFAETSLSANTGTIELTFNNKGSLPHNWTLTRDGEAEAVNNEAVTDAPNYQSASAVAQTNTINGGESQTISFEVSEPGTYTFICTFPGHFAAGMVGTLEIAAGDGSAPAAGGESSGASSSATMDTGDAASLTFVPAEFEVAAGDVALTFNNKGALPHNWTLTRQGEEDAVNSEAVTDSPNYQAASALAQTNTINGGESQTINFTVEPGTYSYICTFPGHLAAGMRGTMIVK